jgi:hypothetical protein
VDELNNIQTFIRLLNSIREDGALERDDWLLLLPLMLRLIKQLRDSIESRPFLVIALAGVEKVLDEVLEHVQENG